MLRAIPHARSLQTYSSQLSLHQDSVYNTCINGQGVILFTDAQDTQGSALLPLTAGARWTQTAWAAQKDSLAAVPKAET